MSGKMAGAAETKVVHRKPLASWSVRGLFLLGRSWAAPLAKPSGRGSAPQRQQHAIDSGAHAATPSTRRSSETGHARRPLMRMGRIGPSSRQAQMRRVCCARLRCPAASLVGSAARVSCASGVSSWCAIVESLSGLLRWLYWLAATPAARNMQPLAICKKPYFMRVARGVLQPLCNPMDCTIS